MSAREPLLQGRRAVIVSGGTLGPWALTELQEDDYLIGADRGAYFLVENGRTPDLSIGDFDSVAPDELKAVRRGSRTFVSCDPVMKDWTDTEMALVWALDRGPREIRMLGVLGTRLDHSLANIQLLVQALRRGIPCSIADAHNELTLTDGSLALLPSRFTHVSLLPLTLEVTGVTLEGFRYPLQDAVLTMGQSLGVSNVQEQPTARISVREGLLLVIRSLD
ncbi:thiamine diphosphokinase [Paenibacillus sp. CC-CFT747]|nr:thiamine diphosphokinase [Paenibacillus sp. CC-CFT747]